MGIFSQVFKDIGRKDWARAGAAAEKWAATYGAPAVDGGGAPLRLYHGTNASGFSEFLPRMAGSNSGAMDAKNFPVFLSTNADVASEYAVTRGMRMNPDNFGQFLGTPGYRPGIIPMYASLRNPLVYDAGGAGYTEKLFKELAREASSPQYDAFIVKNVNDAIFKKLIGDTYAIKNPAQVKSIFNRGTFDPKTSNFMRAVAPVGVGGGLLAAMGWPAGEAQAATGREDSRGFSQFARSLAPPGMETARSALDRAIARERPLEETFTSVPNILTTAAFPGSAVGRLGGMAASDPAQWGIDGLLRLFGVGGESNQ